METKITEREKIFDKPEELLKEKENLLQAQWKLDEKKKLSSGCENQMMNKEKLLELVEEQVTRINKQRDVRIQSELAE